MFKCLRIIVSLILCSSTTVSEIYQCTYLDNVDHNIEVEQEIEIYFREVLQNSNSDISCQQIVKIQERFAYEIWTYNTDPSVRFIIGRNNSGSFFLQLLQEEKLCETTIWTTEEKQLLVKMGKQLFFGEYKEIRDFNLPVHFYIAEKDMITQMKTKCELTIQKQISKRLEVEIDEIKNKINNLEILLNKMSDDRSTNFTQAVHFDLQLANSKIKLSNAEFAPDVPETEMVKEENNRCLMYIFFPHEYELCLMISILYVIFSVVNIIMNYFSLRSLCENDNRCVLFYSMTQWLTIRCICSKQRILKQKFDKWFFSLEEPV